MVGRPMVSTMGLLGIKQLQIFNSVVSRIAVDVMHMFMAFESAT